MKVNCLHCGFNIDIGDAYDDYEGQIKCYICHSLLEIRSEEGGLKSVRMSLPMAPSGRSHQPGATRRAAL
jgi:hypothetical protein